jgi:hypothetical protein
MQKRDLFSGTNIDLQVRAPRISIALEMSALLLN